jgi:hypothetical protein
MKEDTNEKSLAVIDDSLDNLEELRDKVQKELAVLELKENDLRTKLQTYTGILHAAPDPTAIKEHPYVKGHYYLPISYLEMNLDECFFGQWKTENFRYSNIANEIVGVIDLWFYHPITAVWLCRTGAAGTQIRYETEYQNNKKVKTDIMDISKKITNALEADFPHLKSDCIRNACLGIGKRFGRDLNRKHRAAYQPLLGLINKEKGQNKDEAKAEALLNKYKAGVDTVWEEGGYQKVKNDAFDIVERAKKEGMDEVDLALLKNYINEAVKNHG